jgi:hypothetical protein
LDYSCLDEPFIWIVGSVWYLASEQVGHHCQGERLVAVLRVWAR